MKSPIDFLFNAGAFMALGTSIAKYDPEHLLNFPMPGMNGKRLRAILKASISTELLRFCMRVGLDVSHDTQGTSTSVCHRTCEHEGNGVPQLT